MNLTGKDSILGNIGEIGGWLTILNSIIDAIKKGEDVYEKLPEAFKQKMPGLLGIGLKDERLFNEILSGLSLDDQMVIIGLLQKCKDFQRNRFINIVAGMEFSPATPKTTEKKIDPKSKAVVGERVTDGKEEVDLRKQFLENLAKVIREKLGGSADEAVEYCLAGRMILENPAHQKLVDAWAKSCEVYEKMLKFFGVTDTAGLLKLAVSKTGQGSKEFEKSGVSFLKRCLTFNQWK